MPRDFLTLHKAEESKVLFLEDFGWVLDDLVHRHKIESVRIGIHNLVLIDDCPIRVTFEYVVDVGLDVFLFF